MNEVYILFSKDFLNYPQDYNKYILQGVFTSQIKAMQYMEDMIFEGAGFCCEDDFKIERHLVDENFYNNGGNNYE